MYGQDTFKFSSTQTVDGNQFDENYHITYETRGVVISMGLVEIFNVFEHPISLELSYKQTKSNKVFLLGGSTFRVEVIQSQLTDQNDLTQRTVSLQMGFTIF